jgi:hypothetical protein
MEYKYTHGVNHTIHVGGAIESFAFSRHGTAPRQGLEPAVPVGVLSVPAGDPLDVLDPAYMGGASGFAIGAFMDTLPKGSIV